MVTVQEEYTKKSKKLLQYVESYKKKEVVSFKAPMSTFLYIT